MKKALTRRRFMQLAAVVPPAALAAAYDAAAQAPTSPSAGTPPPAPLPTRAAAVVPAHSAGPRRGGTFTLARTMSIKNFNPLNTSEGHYAFQRALFNTPIHYDAQLNPQPDLAEKWDFSPDGKTMTLKLREGVKFHSGRELTSDDIRFSIEFAQTNDDSTSRALYKSSIREVDTPSKYVATLSFNTVNPSIFDLMDMLYIMDKETIGSLASTVVGTGPFRIERYIPNDRVEMAAFKDYWEKGKPYLDRYVARTIPDLGSLAINLESGAVDCIYEPSYLDLVRLKGRSDKYSASTGAPGASMYNLAINTKAEYLSNKKVRQAIAWSIDRARYCRTVLQGIISPTCLMWPSHSWAHFKDLEGTIGYDLDKAKALLREAGLEKGFETEILTASKLTYGFGELAQILQADLSKIGIRAKISDLESGQYESRQSKGDILLTVHSYGRANRDPGTMVTGAKAWYNEKEGGWTHFESAEYDNLRKEMQSTLDREKRKATARKIQQMALDECFTNPVSPRSKGWAFANYVKDLKYNMDNSPWVSDIWLER